MVTLILLVDANLAWNKLLDFLGGTRTNLGPFSLRHDEKGS